MLHDWNNGKIKFYCRPPKSAIAAAAAAAAAAASSGGDAQEGAKKKRSTKGAAAAAAAAEASVESESIVLSGFSEGGLDLNDLRELDIRVLRELYSGDETTGDGGGGGGDGLPSDSAGVGGMHVALDSVGESIDLAENTGMQTD